MTFGWRCLRRTDKVCANQELSTSVTFELCHGEFGVLERVLAVGRTNGSAVFQSWGKFARFTPALHPWVRALGGFHCAPPPSPHTHTHTPPLSLWPVPGSQPAPNLRSRSCTVTSAEITSLRKLQGVQRCDLIYGRPGVKRLPR